MKKIIVCIMAAVLSFTFLPNQSAIAATASVSAATTEEANAAKAEALYARLYELRDMDKTNLSPAEKKEFRKEVREIKRQLSDISGGVYISACGLILILILILLFV